MTVTPTDPSQTPNNEKLLQNIYEPRSMHAAWVVAGVLFGHEQQANARGQWRIAVSIWVRVHLAAAETIGLDQEGIQNFAEQLTWEMDAMSVRVEARKDYVRKVQVEVEAQKQAFLANGGQPPEVGRAMQELQPLHACAADGGGGSGAEGGGLTRGKAARKIRIREARLMKETQAALKAEEKVAAQERIASRAPMANPQSERKISQKDATRAVFEATRQDVVPSSAFSALRAAAALRVLAEQPK